VILINTSNQYLTTQTIFISATPSTAFNTHRWLGPDCCHWVHWAIRPRHGGPCHLLKSVWREPTRLVSWMDDNWNRVLKVIAVSERNEHSLKLQICQQSWFDGTINSHQHHQRSGRPPLQANYPQTKNWPLRAQKHIEVLGLRWLGHHMAWLWTQYFEIRSWS
jgi:hypothetical protein